MRYYLDVEYMDPDGGEDGAYVLIASKSLEDIEKGLAEIEAYLGRELWARSGDRLDLKDGKATHRLKDGSSFSMEIIEDPEHTI